MSSRVNSALDRLVGEADSVGEFACLSWNGARVDIGDGFAKVHPDLFEPLLVTIEKGGTIGMHHGELLIGRSAIPLANWKTNAALFGGVAKQ